MTDHESILRRWGALRSGDPYPPQNDETLAAFRAGADALALLRELEWSGQCCDHDPVRCCPSCLGIAPSEKDRWGDELGHDPDCKLALLIGAERRSE